MSDAGEGEALAARAGVTRRAALRASIAALGAVTSTALLGCTPRTASESTAPTLATPTSTARRAVTRVVFIYTRLTEQVVQNNIAIMKKTLSDLGHVENQNVSYEYFDAAADPTRFPAIAKQAVQLDPDVIVCQIPQAARSVLDATSRIPIVFLGGGDVIAEGLATSLARPDRNLTGLTNAAADIAGKRVQVLKEVAPRLTRLAVIDETTDTGSELAAIRRSAVTLGVEVVPCLIEAGKDLEGALALAVSAKVDGLTNQAGFVTGTSSGNEVIAAFALARGWPTINVNPSVGGLMNYNAIFNNQYPRASTYIDRLLRGTPVASLPIESPTGVTCMLNPCTAAKLGLTIPASVRAYVTEYVQCQ